MPSPVIPQSASPNISPVNHGAHAHQDASRILVNGRSNRLEPYGHGHVPAAAKNLPLPLTAPELDEVRKDLMHTSAERAKQRRQQGEVKREAQKDLAHRKAAEIEKKLKAAALEKQKEKEALEALEAANLSKV